ncbi:MAG: hypothetical protein DRR42_07135 [Gammaproteobacteria bacterium]|nr:MAG: hypothetical protein DRR42_07135 [Gammaproteobacteria bacterium]
MSHDEENPRSVNVTPRQLVETAIAVVWMLSAFFVKESHPAIGSSMLVALFLVAGVHFALWRRSQSPEERKKYDRSIREYENKPIYKAVRFVGQGLLMFIILMVVYEYFFPTGVT